MAITITVENGTGVANANSFATVLEAREYATNRGVVLAPDGAPGDDTVAVWLIQAMDYLRTLLYVGYIKIEDHPVPFPRINMYGTYAQYPTKVYPDDVVPPELKAAQLSLVLQLKAGVILLPTNGATAAIKREKIGPLETEYEESSLWISPSLPGVDALLARFLSAGAFRLKTYRA